MSYICSICGLSSEAREPLTKEVVATRVKHYYTMCLRKITRKPSFRKPKPKFHTIFLKDKDYQRIDELKKDGYKLVSEKHSNGTEIEKENNICLDCKGIVS